MFTTILYLLVFGLIFGALARFIVPGPNPMSLLGTFALGIAGSLLGGFLGFVIFGEDPGDGALQASGIIGSLVGSVLLLLGARMLGSGTATRT